MKRYAVIVAAGSGSRMNAGLPKQFMILSGKPVLFYSLQAFFNHDPSTEIILVLSENDFERWESLCLQYKISIKNRIIKGGESRTDSVRNGLAHVTEGLVAIHDGARPLVSLELIEDSFKCAFNNGSGIPSVLPKDSLRIFKGEINQAVNREDYRIMQTPQSFQTDKIKEAYSDFGNEPNTDDASVFEKAGYLIILSKGDYRNIKITTPEDILIAEALMKG